MKNENNSNINTNNNHDDTFNHSNVSKLDYKIMIYNMVNILYNDHNKHHNYHNLNNLNKNKNVQYYQDDMQTHLKDHR